MKPVKVMKFGGTSVQTADARMQAALRVVSAFEQGFAPVVVVSAIGRRGAPYATDTLIEELRQIDSSIKVEPRELDMMLACGEIFSAVTFVQTLAALGRKARSFRGGQAGIRTDGVYGNARIESINPTGILNSIQRGEIPVICGFQGTFAIPGEPGGELTTLGRGGSDTTAAAVGAALGARAVEIFTDVDGVKTADPDFVPNAPTLARVSYEEVAEIAHLGARVLHPRAAEIAMKYEIPLYVKNTFGEGPTTEIIDRGQVEGRRVTGVTHSGKLVYLEFDLRHATASHCAELQAKVYNMMARYGVNLFMINLSPSVIGFAVMRSQYPTVKDLLDGLVAPIGEGKPSIYMLQLGDTPSREAETQAELLGPLGEVVRIPLALTESCTIVSLVGSDFLANPKVFFDMLRCLDEANIQVWQTSNSDLSVSCLVPESETHRAVARLHSQFGLESIAAAPKQETSTG